MKRALAIVVALRRWRRVRGRGARTAPSATSAPARRRTPRRASPRPRRTSTRPTRRCRCRRSRSPRRRRIAGCTASTRSRSTCGAPSSSIGSISSKVKTGGRVGDAADSLGEMERELDRLKHQADRRRRLRRPSSTPGSASTSRSRARRPTPRCTRSAMRPASRPKGLHATLDGKPIEPFALVDVDARRARAWRSPPTATSRSRRSAVAIAGQSQLIELELEPKPATVTVHTEAGAHDLDRRSRRAGDSRSSVPAGKHLLVVTHRGREPFGKELVVDARRDADARSAARETGRRTRRAVGVDRRRPPRRRRDHDRDRRARPR